MNVSVINIDLKKILLIQNIKNQNAQSSTIHWTRGYFAEVRKNTPLFLCSINDLTTYPSSFKKLWFDSLS